jgi:hypothetical protein
LFAPPVRSQGQRDQAVAFGAILSHRAAAARPFFKRLRFPAGRYDAGNAIALLPLPPDLGNYSPPGANRGAAGAVQSSLDVRR